MAAERLRAQAQGGQIGLAAYDDAQRTIAQSRAQAAQQALAGASTRGAPSRAQSEVDSIVSSPASYYTEAARQGRDIAGQNVGAANAAQAAYLASVGAHGSLGATRRAEQSSAAQAARDAYNRYGGYGSSGEFDNAATGGALVLQDQAMGEQDAVIQSALNAREQARQAGSYEARARSEMAKAARAAQPTRTSGTPTGLDLDLAQDQWLRSGDPGPIPGTDRGAQIAGDEQARQAGSYAAQAAAAEDALRRQATARSDAARSQTVQTEMEAAAQQAFLQSPQGLQDLRYQFATDYLGADPMEARGRFAPLGDQEIMQNELDLASVTEAYNNLMMLGTADAGQAAAEMFAANTGGYDVGQVSSATGLTEMDLAAYSSAPTFQQDYMTVMSSNDPVTALMSVQDPLSAAILAEMLAGLDPLFRDQYRAQLEIARSGLG